MRILACATSRRGCSSDSCSLLLTWALNNSVPPSDAPLTRFSNSAPVVLLFLSVSLFPAHRTAHLLSDEGQQPSAAPGCAHGIESLGVYQCTFVRFANLDVAIERIEGLRIAEIIDPLLILILAIRFGCPLQMMRKLVSFEYSFF